MAKDLVDLTVHCDDGAPGVVRAAISSLDGIAAPVLEDSKLVASELVTNAVRHSRCAEQEFLTVRVTGDGWLRLSVSDPGRSGGVAQIADRPVSLGGAGAEGGGEGGEPVGHRATPAGL